MVLGYAGDKKLASKAVILDFNVKKIEIWCLEISKLNAKK